MNEIEFLKEISEKLSKIMIVCSMPEYKRHELWEDSEHDTDKLKVLLKKIIP